MNESRVQELEIKIAFLEEAMERLSDEHFAQQKELETLKVSHAQIVQSLNNSGSQSGETISLDAEVPPHY